VVGREKGERKVNPLEQPGYRNGYGKTRRFTMSVGTMEIGRPRVRNLDERTLSAVVISPRSFLQLNADL
jgi:hypothetical protein